MSFFKQFLISIYQFDRYKELVQIRSGKVILYEIILFFVTTFISFVPIIFVFISFGGTEGIIKEFIPDFKIENGILSAENNVFNENGTLVIIDSNNVRSDFDLQGAKNGVIFDKEKIIINNGLENQLYFYKDIMNELNIQKIEKNDIFNYISEINYSLFLFFAITFITLIISEVFGIFFLSIFTLIFSCILKKGLKYDCLVKITVYARSLYVCLVALLALFGIGIDFIFAAVLNLAYLFFAVKKME